MSSHPGSSRSAWTRRVLGAAIGVCLCAGAGASAAQALVVGGETIADAALSAAARREGEVVLYGTYPPDPMKPILDAFKADTGLRVDYVRLPTRNMFDRAVSEFSAGRLAADYLDLTDLVLVAEYLQKGMLQPHKVPAFERISPDLKDPEGRWYALIRDVNVIGVNTALVKKPDYPVSWRDLLDPKWRGKVGASSIDAGGSALSGYSFLRLAIAPDYWSKFAPQNPRFYATAAPVATDLVRGETSVVMVPISVMVPQIRKGAPILPVFPKEGISSFPIAGGVAAKARHPNAARVYLNWMTSRRGGTVIANAGAYAAHADASVPRPEGIQYPPADQVWNLKFDVWSKFREPYLKEWHAIFDKR